VTPPAFMGGTGTAAILPWAFSLCGKELRSYMPSGPETDASCSSKMLLLFDSYSKLNLDYEEAVLFSDAGRRSSRCVRLTKLTPSLLDKLDLRYFFDLSCCLLFVMTSAELPSWPNNSSYVGDKGLDFIHRLITYNTRCTCVFTVAFLGFRDLKNSIVNWGLQVYGEVNVSITYPILGIWRNVGMCICLRRICLSFVCRSVEFVCLPF
jgi:hypothetical protein